MAHRSGVKAGERRATARRLADRRAATPVDGWTTATDDRLAQTYFRTRGGHPPSTVPRRRAPLVVAGVSLFTCVVGLWVVLGPVHRLSASFGRGRASAPVDFTETFDQPTVAPRVGVWLGAPDDATQGCRLSYTALQRVGTTGYGLAVDYDVESIRPATAGVWLALPRGGVSAHAMLSFFIHGDPSIGYSETCVVELQTARGRSRYYLDGITEAWQQVSIPLERFVPAPDAATAHDLLILFEDWNVTRKQGRVYLDEIRVASDRHEPPPAARLPSRRRVEAAAPDGDAATGRHE